MATKYFSQLPIDKKYKAGDKIDIQILKTGKRNHPHYGYFEVNEDTVDEMLSNFESKKYGIDLALDENHDPDHKALGWFRSVYKKGKDSLFATIELTKDGAEKLTKGLYKYFSPEIVWEKKDEETGDKVKNLLVGGALTNRPFFKNMEGLMACETTNPEQEGQNFYFFSTNQMEKFLQLIGKYTQAGKVNAQQFSELKAVFNELPEDEKAAAQESLDTMESVVEKTDEEKAEEARVLAEKEAEQKRVQDEEAEKARKEAEGNEGNEEDKEKKGEFSEAKYSEIFAENARLKAQIREKEVSEKVSGFVFSETNSKGIVLPKARGKIESFVNTLTSSQEKVFFEIVSGISTEMPNLFKEMGKATKEGDEGPDPKVVKYYMESMGFSMEDAKKAAMDVK